MIYRHLIFIVNEFSRKGKKTTPQLLKHMKKHSQTYEIHITQFKKHATALAETLAEKINDSTLIVAVGGDGTLNEVVKGVINAHKAIPVAYIPTGSGNDFARSRNLPMNIEAAIEAIIDQTESTWLDVLSGRTGNEHLVAVNSIGFGLDGMVISKIDQTKNKQTIGKFSYLASVLTAFFSQDAFSLKVDVDNQQHTYDDVLLVVCANTMYFGGGIPIHPLAQPDDGIIDIVIAEKVTFFELLSLLYSVMINQKHLNHKKMHAFRGTSCTVSIDSPQYGQRDGELIDKRTQTIAIDVVKQQFWL